MKQWLGPAAVALLVAAAAWQGGLSLATYGLMEVAVRRTAADTGFNKMRYNALATPENQPIVRPSPDLAYAACAYDLKDGPVEVTMAPVPGRYSSLSVFDARTDVVFVRNDQQAKEKPFQIVIARDGQAVPAGKEVVRVDYDRGIALIRLLLNTPSEIKSLEPLRRQSSCRQI
ncbi:MAG: hypothetical protein RIQ75_1099 [Pseudomonadota bacterium]|jgi:uncharacterized membrane protein